MHSTYAKIAAVRRVAIPAPDMSAGVPVVVPQPCPPGHYCPEGTGISTSFPCPAGSYFASTRNEAASNCTACTAGSYCETPGLDAVTGPCAAGHYCTGGALAPTPVNHLVGDATGTDHR